MKVCIVQARLTSSRLPGKVMYPLGGLSVIRHVIRKATETDVDRVVLAVPDDTRSTLLAMEARSLGIETFYGSEDDVLERYFFAALNNRAKIIMRITADCPLIDPEKCNDVLNALGSFDYCSNCYPRSVSKGLDCEVFTMDALTKAYKNATDPYDREHVTPWIRNNLNIHALRGDYNKDDNFCLDTADDYLRLKKLYESI